MEGVAGLQPVAADTVAGQSGDSTFQVGAGTGEHGVGAVVRGDRQARVLIGEALDALGRGEDRRHPAARRQVAEQPAALREQPHTVFQAEYAGDAGRGVLADAVAEDHVGLEAPRLPEPGQAHLDGEDRRLGVAGLPQRLLGAGAVIENDVQQRLFEYVSDRGSALLHGRGEDRLGLEQFLGHAGELAALSREQPGGLRLVRGSSAHQARRRTVVGQRAEQFTCGLKGIHHERGAVLEVGAARTRGDAYVRERGLGVCGQPAAVVLGGLQQRGRGPRRQRQHHEAPVVGFLDRALRGNRGRRFLKQDMGIGAREAERTDARDARPVAACPGGGLVDDLHGDAVPRDVRRRVREVQVLRQFLVLERQDHLDDPGDAGGGLEVSDVRLHRADQQRIGRIASGAVRRGRGLDLDRVAQRRAGAVCLQVADVAGRQARALQCLGDNPLLRNAIGHGQAARGAVLVDGATADDGPDPVAVADGVLESLHHDDAAALTADVAVRGGVEGLALAVGGQHARLREGDHGGRAEDDVRATGQRQVALAELQGLAGLVDGHQRRAACGVDGDGRTLQAKAVTDAAGGRGARGADGHVGLDLRVGQLARGHAQVVVGGQADEHTGLRVGQGRRGGARVLDRAPRHLEQQALLRVHHLGFAGGHPEERCVEADGVVEEAGAAGDDLAAGVRVGVEELVDVPAVLGHLGYGVPALAEHLPEGFGVGGSGEARGVADDRKAGRFRSFDPCHEKVVLPRLPVTSGPMQETVFSARNYVRRAGPIDWSADLLNGLGQLIFRTATASSSSAGQYYM